MEHENLRRMHHLNYKPEKSKDQNNEGIFVSLLLEHFLRGGRDERYNVSKGFLFEYREMLNRKQ